MFVPSDLIRFICNYIPLDELRPWINPDKIIWSWLSDNPNAIPMLEKNPDKINWYILSENPNAIHLLEKNQNKINWCRLSKNPSIFDVKFEQNLYGILNEILL